MKPLIGSGDLVTIAPVDASRLEVGDIILVKVSGNVYLHLVGAIDSANARVLVKNNRGGTNGWAGFGAVAGICTTVAGMPRARTAGKIRS